MKTVTHWDISPFIPLCCFWSNSFYQCSYGITMATGACAVLVCAVVIGGLWLATSSFLCAFSSHRPHSGLLCSEKLIKLAFLSWQNLCAGFFNNTSVSASSVLTSLHQLLFLSCCVCSPISKIIHLFIFLFPSPMIMFQLYAHDKNIFIVG